MPIPWATALYLAKKLIPVVMENAPDLLRGIERMRPASAPEAAPSNPTLASLQAEIAAHERTIAMQSNSIMQLETQLNAVNRSVANAWRLAAVTAVLSVAVILYLLFRS